jgi:6-pyruvoyltetrahydropterin/6-carboxytetrahydropterin synthase
MIFKITQNFSSAHFYHQPQWSEEKNQAEFGKCFTTYGHGHDYTVEIEFELQEQNQAKKEIEMQLLELSRELVETLDHQHLNFVIPEFQIQIPTTENISLWIWKKMEAKLKHQVPAAKIRYLRLFENPEIWVELSEPASGLSS